MSVVLPPDDAAFFATAPLPWVTPASPVSAVSGVDEAARVLFTRVVARRNFEGFPFWVAALPATCAAVAARVGAHAESLGWGPGRALADLAPAARGVLRERERLPERPALAEAPGEAGRRAFKTLFFAPSPATHALLGEVEHWTRFQVFPGLAAPETVEAALEDVATEDGGTTFVRSAAFGHLCSDPAYAGSGLSFEVALHLPGLSLDGAAEQTRRAVAAMGFVLAPLAPRDPGGAAAGFFRLSTRGGIDRTGAAFYRDFAAMAAKVLATDEAAQARRRAREPGLSEDRAHRALGVLRDARRLEAAELPGLVARARVGVYEGFFPADLLPRLEELRVRACPFHLASGTVPGGPDEAVARAALARSLLNVA